MYRPNHHFCCKSYLNCFYCLRKDWNRDIDTFTKLYLPKYYNLQYNVFVIKCITVVLSCKLYILKIKSSTSNIHEGCPQRESRDASCVIEIFFFGGWKKLGESIKKLQLRCTITKLLCRMYAITTKNSSKHYYFHFFFTIRFVSTFNFKFSKFSTLLVVVSSFPLSYRYYFNWIFYVFILYHFKWEFIFNRRLLFFGCSLFAIKAYYSDIFFKF